MKRPWPPTIPVEARRGRYGIGSISYPSAHDPTHRQAWNAVATQKQDWSQVIAPDGTVLFKAWRITATSWAWQTPIMAAPAFMPYSA